MTRLSLQREAGGFAIEQPAFAEGRLEVCAEIGGRPGQRGHDRGPADDARIDNLDLGQVDPGVDVDLVACVTPVEPRRPVRARRHEVGEAEASARHRPCGAGQPEIAPGALVEERVIRDELGRMGVERRVQRAIARRSIEVGREVRLALERGPGERPKTAELARRDLQPAANDLRREEAGIARVEIRGGELERIEGDVAAERSRAAQRELHLAADHPGERGVGERKAAHRRLALETNPRRFVGERAVRDGMERGGDMVERSFRDTDLSGVERAFDGRARDRSGDRGVEVELTDLRAGNGAGVDFDAEDVVRRPAALDVEPGVGRDEVQARRGDARIVVEVKVPLKRRLAGEDRADDRRRHAFELGVEVEGQPPPGVLPRDDDLAFRPDVRAGGEVELRREIVERARAVEGEPGWRQAGKIDEMDEQAPGRLVGIDAERELVGGGHIGHQRLELAQRVEPSRGQREIEPLGRRPQRRLAGDVEARRDSDDRLAERQLLDGELLDDYLDRQLGQDRLGRGVARWRRRRLGRKRALQKLHVPDRELVDLQPAT